MTAINIGPQQLDIIGVVAGDDTVVDLNITRDGTPEDTTGAVVASQVRRRPTDPDPALITAVITVVDETQGQYKITYPGPQVRTALGTNESLSLVYDANITLMGAGAPVTLLKGAFRIVSDVTR